MPSLVHHQQQSLCHTDSQISETQTDSQSIPAFLPLNLSLQLQVKTQLQSVTVSSSVISIQVVKLCCANIMQARLTCGCSFVTFECSQILLSIYHTVCDHLTSLAEVLTHTETSTDQTMQGQQKVQQKVTI